MTVDLHGRTSTPRVRLVVKGLLPLHQCTVLKAVSQQHPIESGEYAVDDLARFYTGKFDIKALVLD